MTKEIVGNRLHEVLGWFKEGLRHSRHGFVLMGKALYTLKKEKLWRKEIEHMPSFKYWVEHSLHISIAQALRLIQIYQEVGHLLDEFPAEISKVTLLLPYLHDKTDDEKKALLTMANECTVEDLKNNIKEMHGQKEKCTDNCPHSDLEAFYKCKRCGKWVFL